MKDEVWFFNLNKAKIILKRYPMALLYKYALFFFRVPGNRLYRTDRIFSHIIS